MTEPATQEDWPRTVEEFEAWHARQPERWEFIWGLPRMMAPASLDHTTIKGNVFAALRASLAGTPCQVFVDGAQILTDEISAIPDVVVTCVEVDSSTPIIPEPAIIVEVMSPHGATDDTHRKWFAYRKSPSLLQYLVISQDQRVVQVHSRAGDLWRERFVSEGRLALDDPSIELEIGRIYEATEVAA